jgi:hypothetical protein
MFLAAVLAANIVELPSAMIRGYDTYHSRSAAGLTASPFYAVLGVVADPMVQAAEWALYPVSENWATEVGFYGQSNCDL